MTNTDERPRIRDLGVTPGVLPTGDDNALTDVPPVRVGHVSRSPERDDESTDVRTGVTAIHPHEGNVFERPVRAAAHVINGHGKVVGLPQVREVGEIETPIALTNTLNVWRVADALVDATLESNPDALSINPVVGECNDGAINDVQARHVTPEHVHAALDGATESNREEGSVGAGVGMASFGWKSGIGTASRRIDLGGATYTVGALVLSNTGEPGDLRIGGTPVGEALTPPTETARAGGSMVAVLATDAPLSVSQLERVARRGEAGLGRTGAIAGHRTGDFVVAFSTAEATTFDGDLRPAFRGAVEAVEESIYNSLVRATTVVGKEGATFTALPLDDLRSLLDS
ncbi:P1 family peptidase [Haloplanus sp. C73]|uniref:P1 family peptidase n=1 Tax=Haloplanus sp. C73 TaxID=3421641 RepID=UPI003EBD3B7B